MGMLPFDDWIYHLSDKRDEINSKHDKLMKDEAAIQESVINLNTVLNKYKSLVANNAVLVYIMQTVQMTDLKLADFQTQIDALPPPVKGDVVLNFMAGVTELIGGVMVLKFLVNLGKLAKNKIFSGAGAEKLPEGEAAEAEKAMEGIAEEMSEAGADSGLVAEGEEASIEAFGKGSLEEAGEAAAEATIESATTAALASTGIGIVFAVAIDVILGAINGAKERDQLNDYISKLDEKMKIIQGFQDKTDKRKQDLQDGCVTEFKRFIGICDQMFKIVPADKIKKFDYNFPQDFSQLDKYLDAQTEAVTNFSLLLKLRQGWIDAKARDPDADKSAVISAVLIFSPKWVTKPILVSIWDDVLAKYSDDLKNAK